MIQRLCCALRRFTYALLLTAFFVQAAAQDQTGHIQVKAEPNAKVFLDGTFVGVTNLDEGGLVLLEVPSGRHKLRFVKPGFAPREDMVVVETGRVAVYELRSPVPEVRIAEEEVAQRGGLRPRVGALTIECLPAECSISLPSLGVFDYQNRGRWVAKKVLAIKHRVRISRGEKVLNEVVEVQADHTLRLIANFAAAEATLEQRVQPGVVQPLPAAPTATAPPAGRELQTFEARLERPMAVILDNADAAYPQSGLVEASSVFEMPVEGGLTRLMPVYTRAEPSQVGPIRSARDYFLDTVLNMGGTLVHVGGAPSTVSRIETQGLATVDAEQEKELFSVRTESGVEGIYATGPTLREAVSRLNPGGRALSGTVFRPAEGAPGAEALNVIYSADYTSGFRYLPEVDQYRWLRDGEVAADASGEDVLVDAVVVARVTAFPYLDDPAGRLYLPLDGGEATLYMDGKAVPGRWNPTGGFQFVTEGGEVVDLTPFKHWILYVPEYADVSVQ